MSTQWTCKVVDAEAKGLRMLKSEDIPTVLNQHGMLGLELVEVIQMAGNQATLHFKKAEVIDSLSKYAMRRNACSKQAGEPT